MFCRNNGKMTKYRQRLYEIDVQFVIHDSNVIRLILN